MEIKIAENIRAQRKARGLTQEQLAEAMGVTVGAVSKWELGASVPDISIIMELADFFETSVDVLLGYEWRKQSQSQAVEEIRLLRREKRFDEGIRAAEKALQKYPNSFEVVYQSGLVYYLTMNKTHMPRAVELLERACGLIDQNSSETVSLLSIQNDIAGCYLVMEQFDEALDRLKKNNMEGINNATIGNTLSQHYQRPEEALQYLTEALVRCYGEFARITLGYANIYAEQGQLQKAYDVVMLMYDLERGLRGEGTVNSIDRDSVRTMTLLAEVSALQGETQRAYDWLKQAKQTAERFDASPVYSLADMKFYHSKETAVSYDDFGDTAMEGIRRFLEDDEVAPHLRPVWERLIKEDGR